MNIKELSLDYNILDDTIHAVEKVSSITGKEMDFRWVDDMMSHAKLKAAREFMEQHIVYLRKDKAFHLNHLIVHECYHIYRFWSVSKSQRKILSSTNESAQNRIETWKKELGSKSMMYPPHMFTMWNNGLMALFYNAVTDSRIERSIYFDYPGLRAEQLVSLKNLEDEIKQSMSPSIQKMIPLSLYFMVGSMNYTFLKQLEPIIGRTWRKSFKGNSDILSMGQKLLRVIPNKDEGLSQDIAILNKWSDILNIEGIKWYDFEDVPREYAETY